MVFVHIYGGNCSDELSKLRFPYFFSQGVKLTFLSLPFSMLTKQDAQDDALFVEGYPVNHGHGLNVKSQVNQLDSKHCI